MKNHKKILAKELTDNTFKMIGSDWMLVTAGNKERSNTMTAAWGGLGFLWNRNVAFVYIRPNRYTFKFTEENERMSLTFFDDKFRDTLKYCGTKSGRDVDKIKECNLTLKFTDNRTPYFEEARVIIEGKKIYVDDIDPKNMLDKELKTLYPESQFHRVYTIEIENIWIKK